MVMCNDPTRAAGWSAEQWLRVRGRMALGAIGVTLLMAGGARSADAPVFKSPTVRAARSELLTSLNRAHDDFDQAFQKATRKYIEALEAGIKQATKEGDLGEANKLSAELQLVRTAPYAGRIPVLVGTWKMRWPTSSTNYSFDEHGNVHRDLRGAPTDGVLRRSGDDVVIDFGNNSLMRVNVSNQRLILEYWDNQTDYPGRYPNQIGIGERLN